MGTPGKYIHLSEYFWFLFLKCQLDANCDLSSLLGSSLFRLNDQVTLNSKEETNSQLSFPSLSPVKFLCGPAVEPAPEEVQIIPFQGL